MKPTDLIPRCEAKRNLEGRMTGTGASEQAGNAETRDSDQKGKK